MTTFHRVPGATILLAACFLQRDRMQQEHLKNIIRLSHEGKLLMAGPFLDDQAIRGIFIVNVESVDEARRLRETDPAVKAGILLLELHPWYGPATLAEMRRIHAMVVKKSVAE